MVPVTVHHITICRPNETTVGIAGNRADRLSRVQGIHNPLHHCLQDFLNVLILLDIPTDVDQALMVLHQICILSLLTTARPPRGQRRMGHLRLLLGG
jgi:hypothetical protein